MNPYRPRIICSFDGAARASGFCGLHHAPAYEEHDRRLPFDLRVLTNPFRLAA